MLRPNDNHTIHVLEVLGNAIIGGMENYVRNLIAHLPVERFRVTCLCPYESKLTAELRRLGCTVYVTFMDYDPPWRSIQSTVEIIRHERIDLIHAHLPKAHALAGLAGCVTHRPVVATIHGMMVTTEDLGISRTTGTHLAVVCQEAYHQALALGISPEDVTLIPNGVDLSTFTPNPPASGESANPLSRETVSPAAFRQALGVPDGTLLVGFVGRLAWEKGPDQFIRMAQYVHKQRLAKLASSPHFVLVGDGPMKGELVEMIREMELEEVVHLAGLHIDTWAVYPALDVVVQTSRVEGMPLALLEAMACGRPVIAMGVGGVLELLEVDVTGFLAAGGDWEGVGNALLPLLDDPARRQTMGQAARRRAETLYDLAHSVQRTSDLFCRLVSKKTRYRTADLVRKPVGNGTR